MLEQYAKVLVTGGCGFIGSHLVGALLSLGKEMVVLDEPHETYPQGKTTTDKVGSSDSSSQEQIDNEKWNVKPFDSKRQIKHHKTAVNTEDSLFPKKNPFVASTNSSVSESESEDDVCLGSQKTPLISKENESIALN